MVLAVFDEGVRRADRARSPLPREDSTPGAVEYDERPMRKDSNNGLDVHQSITNSIVAAIEAGAGNATLPWHRTGASSILPKNVATGNACNGINVLALWATAQERAYTHSLWGTYKQFQSLDAQVRKGEKAALVIFYKLYDVEPDPQHEDHDGRRRVAKASWVFNVAQVDGYTIGEPLPPLPPLQRNARAEAFVAATVPRYA